MNKVRLSKVCLRQKKKTKEPTNLIKIPLEKELMKPTTKSIKSELKKKD
jgi:hypothetical protein